MKQSSGTANVKQQSRVMIAHLNTEGEHALTIVYTLVKSTWPDCATSSETVYSLLCEMFSGDDPVEYEFVHDFTRCESTAETFLKMMCAGAVTPCTVKDVAYDYISLC